MSHASLYTAFNNVVVDMLSDMIRRFPGNKELSACLTFHNMASKANIRLPYQKFVEYAIMPYGEKLFAHDDAFFYEKSYDEFTDEGAGLVEAMKHLWSYMTEEDKQCVHDYLDLLLSVHLKISS
ncbi:hypothetical protein TetV_655 [Tetraselmis virus 1]|uniref:Uncharacterized protein n=1 Tax=Tetraselmis virus 1 TaxID=2060617 RepID=A0A2P0VPC1_9VIRU|nr:hypothetical protein QJ968_gp399 [Tetraselmis virus 1]AUF82737.1 hypothetical protein TetV_655 [Tetraselmis virus 1]